jgi:hypothetical protein
LNMVMNIEVSYKTGRLMTSWVTVSLSRRTLCSIVLVMF